LDQAISLAVLEQTAAIENQDWRQHLHPPDRAIVHLPKVILDEDAANHVKHGRQIQLESEQTRPITAPDDEPNFRVVRAYAPTGDLLAILKPVEGKGNIWKPKKVFQI